MRKINLCLFALTAIFVIACKNTTVKEEITEVQPVEEHRNRYTAADGHTIGINVNLDRGAKWITNRETSTGIAKMLGMVNEFTSDPTIEDYRGIHKKLATEYQIILQKCSMTGDARNELQHYLEPLKEKINTLSIGDLETCNKVLPEIKDYLLKYSHFFF